MITILAEIETKCHRTPSNIHMLKTKTRASPPTSAHDVSLPASLEGRSRWDSGGEASVKSRGQSGEGAGWAGRARIGQQNIHTMYLSLRICSLGNSKVQSEETNVPPQSGNLFERPPGKSCDF